MHNVMEDRQLRYDRGKLTDAFLLKAYEALVRPRMIEEKMLSLLRQGKISKWFSGIGQEAISVGATLALNDDEYILPMHRNLGVFTTRNMPFPKLFAQWQGKATGYSKGRERSFHFGSQEHKIVGMISHLGPQMGIADGIALAHKLKKEQRCTVVFTGDGATSEGDFHESVNVAAVWDLPVIFLIENNGYGLSTPSSEQFRMKNFVDKAIGYGIESQMIAGNNILEVYQNIARIADSIRERPRPVLVECMTFRMRGHEEASGTKYVPKELFEEWGRKDPVANYENWLLQKKILSDVEMNRVRAGIKQEIEDGLKVAFEEPEPVPVKEVEERDVYAPLAIGHSPLAVHDGAANGEQPTAKSEKRFIDAISDGMAQSMERHPGLVLMGQDIAEYGGAFKITEGFVERFGKDRVRNTPLCESAIVGAALGLSIKGMKGMVEMQFADFVTEAMTQIINNLAKIHWRWGQNADVVIRMPTGAGVGAGPFHSQSNEMWFVKTPGLKVVYPSSVHDAKGLLMAAFDDPNPVIFFEHKALYRSLTESIPDAPYAVEIGKARTVREGSALSIITYGMGVHWAMEAINAVTPSAVEGRTSGVAIDAEIIDLRTLLPLDTEAIYASVRKTGRALVLHEDTLTAGLGGEISALINEHCFDSLDAPVMRVASWDAPVPFAVPLEQGYLPKGRVKEAIDKLIQY